MLKFQWDRFASDGTPVVRDEVIAAYAERLISDYNPEYLERPWELDPLRFTEHYLKANLQFVDLYYEDNEEKIAGATVFKEEKIRIFDRENLCTRMETFEGGTILIDNETMEEGHEAFARFTILHEGGHFCLHPSVFQNRNRGMNHIECGIPFSAICCRKSGIEEKRTELKTQEDFREHQANVFAAAIAMPGKVFTEIARDALLQMGCEEGFYELPTLRETDYDECADSLYSYMANKFRVSKSAARVQLRKKGLVLTTWEAMKLRRGLS